VATLHDIRAVT